MAWRGVAWVRDGGEGVFKGYKDLTWRGPGGVRGHKPGFTFSQAFSRVECNFHFIGR